MNELTLEERQSELEIADERIAFLDAKLAKMNSREIQSAENRFSEAGKSAIQLLHRKLKRNNMGISLPATIKANLKLCSASEMRMHDGTVPQGSAWPESGFIAILNHLILAPKEVIQSLVIHESLHLLYPFASDESKQSLQIRDAVKSGYPEAQHLEEEWVRRAEEKITGKSNLGEAWELAIEEGRDNWRPIYYKIKKECNRSGAEGAFFD